MKNINYLLLIPFVLILGTVFILNEELENHLVSSKYFWFYGCMGITSLSVIILSFINKFHFKQNKTDFFILFLGVTSLFLSYRITGMNTKTVLFILLLILYFYFRILFSINNRNRTILIVVFLLTGLFEAIWGLSQLYGFSPSQHAFFPLTGSFFNPGPYAGYLAVIVPIAFYYLLNDYASITNGRIGIKNTGTFMRWVLSILTFISVLLVVPAAMSRSSWLAFAGGLGFITWKFINQKYHVHNYFKQHKKKIWILTSLIFIFIIIGGFGLYNLKKDSADGRALMWKISLKTVSHHPFGVGLGNFPGTYAYEQASFFESGQGTEQEQFVAGSPEYAFNEYLQICLELGIIPFLLFICVIATALYFGCIKRNIPETASLIALLIFAISSYPFNVLPFLILLTFLLAACSTDPQNEMKDNMSFKQSKVMIISLLFISLIVVIGCIYKQYPVYNAYKDWRYAKTLNASGNQLESKRQYERLVPYLEDQINFLFEYGRLLSLMEDYEQSNDLLMRGIRISGDPMFYNIMGKNYQALKEYKQAEACFIIASNIIPSRHYPFYLLAKLYEESGNMVRAKEMAEYVICKPPKVPSGAIDEMKDEMKQILDKE